VNNRSPLIAFKSAYSDHDVYINPDQVAVLRYAPADATGRAGTSITLANGLVIVVDAPVKSTYERLNVARRDQP
jgi:hypothetical protein